MDKEIVFKDVMGRWITSGLVRETAQQSTYVIWSLDELRQLYIACNDLTGYVFATTILGGWEHFLAMKMSPALEAKIESWEEELEVKLRAEALEAICTQAKADSFQAAKFIVSGEWKKRHGAGRPSKAEKAGESKVQARMYEEFGLKVIK